MTILVAALLLGVSAQDASDPWKAEDAHVGYGPLHVTSLSPFQMLRPGLLPRLPSSLPEGRTELRLAETWANMWAFNEDDWILDYEVLYTNFGLVYRATAELLMEVEIEDASRFGGAMDDFIIDFHRAVGAEQRHRTEFPKNDFQFEVAPSHGQPAMTLNNGDRGSFVETALVSLQYFWVRGPEAPLVLVTNLSLRCDLRNLDGLRGGSPVDVALSAAVSRNLGDFYGYLGASVAWYGHEKFQGVQLRGTQAAALGAVEWRCLTGLSVILQYLLTEGVLDNPKPFRRPSHEILLGFKWQATDRLMVELAGLENFVIPDNSADFGLHAAVSVRW